MVLIHETFVLRQWGQILIRQRDSFGQCLQRVLETPEAVLSECLEDQHAGLLAPLDRSRTAIQVTQGFGSAAEAKLRCADGTMDSPQFDPRRVTESFLQRLQ